MTIAYCCLIAVIVVTYTYTGLAKFAKGGYNNNCPREYISKLTGWPKRAYWAHLNSLEVLPQFFGALIIAHIMKMPQLYIDISAISFLILRILSHQISRHFHKASNLLMSLLFENPH